MATKRISLLPHQAALLRSTAEDVALVAGLGAAKSYGAILLALHLGEINAPAPGMVVLPTIPMLRNAFVRAFEEFSLEFEIEYRYFKMERKITVYNKGPREFDILLATADRPELLVGTTLGHVIVDEAGLCSREAFDKLRPRVRHRKAKRLVFCAVGTPEGLGPFYEFATADDTHLIRAHTRDNVFLTPSPDEYIAKRLAHFTDDEREMYISGEFISLGGRVYTHYSEAHNEETCTDPLAGEQVIGADFGSGTMAWCLGRIKDETLHIWGEHVGRNVDTWTHVQELGKLLTAKWQRLRGGATSWEMVARRYVMHADAAARYSSVRPSAASVSDHQIVRGAGIEVRAPRQNPRIRDRVISLNEACRVRRILIDPQGAPYHAKCMRLQGYGTDGMPKKSKDDRSGPSGLDHGCLPAETLIATESGAVPIMYVRVGDMVHTRAGLRRVLWSGQTGAGKELIEIDTYAGSLSLTPEHLVWRYSSGWTQARKLFPSTKLATQDGVTSVKSVRQAPSADVYDLTVEDEPEFFANGVLVHNSDALGYLVHARWPILSPHGNQVLHGF